MKKLISLILAAAALLTGCAKQPTEAQTALQQKISEGYIETMENATAFTKISNSFYKSDENANPISGNIFCADPTAVEYNGRLYVYGTNDHQQYEAVGDNGSNTYEHIKSFVIFSTDDMVNWTYHGKIETGEIAPWIISSWAPSITSRVEADGLTHFYLYFSNNGCGVGVLTATDPCGPWSDPLGQPLISTATEGLTDCPNPFDPGVCIDDNGVGWLSFGGGRASGGSNYMPGTARIVQLGEDMLSLSGEIAEIPAPYFFEASELNYINGTYVYTYNTSWDSRSKWEIDGIAKPSTCSMAYMTTKTPLDSDSWQYRGDYFYNPGESGMDYSNNHSHLHKYNGKYYLFHHNMLRQSMMETRGGFRSLAVVEIQVDEQTLEITKTGSTAQGVQQAGNPDPYAENQGETLFTSGGIGYEYDGALVKAAKSEEDGAWIYIKGVDFGEREAEFFTAVVKGSGTIEVRADDMANPAAAAISFENGEYTGVYGSLSEQLSGTHDLYIMISSKDICLDSWSFL